MAQKTEIPGIYKDGEGVLINKDNDALKAYKARKSRDRKLDDLELEMTEIKELLLKLLAK
jgi:hypothetical protein